MRDRPGPTTRVDVRTFDDDRESASHDAVATEEPLEIRITAGGLTKTVAITMRTPGADFELAAGFLHAEGVLPPGQPPSRITYCDDPTVDAEQRYNIVTVALPQRSLPVLPGLDRHFAMTSACGVCGKASLDALRLRGVDPLPQDGPRIELGRMYQLPAALRVAQGIFSATGGLHAAGLFEPDATPVCVREDVGRHNAVDKAIGWALLNGGLPLTDHVLMVSGRSSFEIVQKAVVARIPVVCAVSAPSSLAIALADEFGVTLIGFLRGQRCNVYAGAARIMQPVQT
jgi:FdhD protein